MRYLASFFITLFLYATAISTLFYNFDNSFVENKNLQKKEELVKISFVENIEKEIPKEKIIESIKKVEKIEKQEKKEVKKKIIKPKKIEKYKAIPKKILPKNDIEKIEKLVKKTPAIKEKRIVTQQQNIDKEKIRNDFIKKVKEKINKNKFYPKSARRRGIEGDVKVEFSIQKNGTLSELKIKDGKTIFYKAVKKSINDSFPITIDKNTVVFPVKITLTLKYTLS